MSDTFRKQFLDKVCGWDWVLALAFGMNMILLVLLALTIWLGPQNEGTRVITKLSLVFILVPLVIVGSLLRLCKKRSSVDPRASDD